MEAEKDVVLPPHRIEFFQHFIKGYHNHFKKGELNEANHCAVAVLLELQKIICGVDDD